MSETKWTPGPWKATRSEPAEGYDCWWITANLGSNLEKELASVSGGVSTSGPNARLIAAAPELYEALNALVQADDSRETFALFGLADSVDNDGDTYQSEGLATVLRRARSALSKARGETE